MVFFKLVLRTSTGLGFLLCVAATIFVLPWARTVRRVTILAEFNLFWKARAFLLLVGGFWLVRLLYDGGLSSGIAARLLSSEA
jgi:hypothetical protein